MTLKTVIFVLVQIQTLISAKIADIFVLIGYLNLKDFLVNGHN